MKPNKKVKGVFYNVNFITNDWEKIYKVLSDNGLLDGVLIQELGVWKNRNLVEELSKLYPTK